MAQCNTPGNSRPSAPASYGSVYSTSDGSGAYGFSYGFNDQYSAMDEAKRQRINRAAGPCQRLLVFANKCASIIYSKNGYSMRGIFGSAEPRRADADAKGVALCQRLNPSVNCAVLEQFCSP